MEIIRIGPDSPLLKSVTELSDRLADSVGFFPRAAFETAAAERRILVAVDDAGAYLGHLLYWQTKQHPIRVRIQQTCVVEQARKTGVGHDLVRRLIKDTPNTHHIDLYCAREMEAAAFWTSIGFRAIGEKTGRGSNCRTLTHFRWESTADHLFSEHERQLAESTIKLVLDMNIMVDLRLEGKPESSALQDDWLTDVVSFWVTDETWAEIDRDTDEIRRQANRAFANSFGKIQVDHDRAATIAQELRQILEPESDRPQDASDRRQLAYAITGGADVFVTRDEALLRLRDHIQQFFGLRVARPVQVLLELDELLGSRSYAPARLAGSALTVIPVTSDAMNKIGSVFLNHGQNESQRRFRAKLRDALARAVQGGHHELVKHDGDPIAIWVAVQDEVGVTIELLRVAPGRSALTVAAGLLQRLVYEQRRHAATRIRVVDQSLQPFVIEAMEAIGFSEDDGGWVKMCCQGIVEGQQLKGWLDRIDGSHSALAALLASIVGDGKCPITAPEIAELERLFSPCIVESKTVPWYLVPIRPRWARELFDSSLAEQDLYPSSPALMLNHENVYYRSARGPCIQAPARLLWYVSKDQGRDPVRQVRATAPLLSVQIDSARNLYREFQRLGVYGWHDVLQTANGDPDNSIMALRFGACQMLPNPIPGRSLAKFGLSVPQTVTYLSPDKAWPLMYAGMAEAGAS